jgi:hypothetical protein
MIIFKINSSDTEKDCISDDRYITSVSENYHMGNDHVEDDIPVQGRINTDL